MKCVLVVDDEKNVRLSLQAVFENDYRVVMAKDGKEALTVADHESPDVAIVDLMMPGMSGLELIPKLKELDQALTIIVLSAMHDIPSVVSAIQLGASRYLTKPFDVHEVRLVVEMALRDRDKNVELTALESALSRVYNLDNAVGSSPAWKNTLSIVKRAADSSDTTVLILGESGTGKELLARLTHKQSRRRAAPFVPIHCAAIPEQLLESELFGHEKGSFTGAAERRHGCIEMADGGTLFLDEIGEMPAAMQSKLLRFLQDHQFMRVGGRHLHQADVRIIAATNSDLRKGVAEGWFREDLYYRLNVVAINIPPLRERIEDVPLLAKHFLEQFHGERGTRMQEISPTAMSMLKSYDWPGNVRELHNIIERALVLHSNSTQLLPEHLPVELQGQPLTGTLSPPDQAPTVTFPIALGDKVAEMEKYYIQAALEQSNGNLSKAAILLQTTRRILSYKIDSYDLR